MAAKEIHCFDMYQGMRWQVTFSFLFSWFCHLVSGQLHYSIAEELRKGSVIANIVKDLELDIKTLKSQKLSIVSQISEKYFALDVENGNLYVKDRIDREILCRTEATCFLTFDAVLANPLNVFTVTIEIQDINDNPPAFFHDTIILKISEATTTGTFMALQNAEDPDIGTNSVQSYSLSDNKHFTLRKKKSSTDQNTFPELMLEKPLDRETQKDHELILTASDGGDPVKTGTAIIRIIVTDANDNLPVFTKAVYKVSISENIPINSSVLHVNATDRDEGTNAQITYSFIKTSENDIHSPMFSINQINGEIKTLQKLDFELTRNYEMSVQATDGGGFVAHSKVLLEIIDENDNAPEITMTSVSTPIPEDSEPGTVIALIKVHDHDSGENGEAECHLLGSPPFQLVSTSSSYYRIITTSVLDREKVQLYNITILANDKGSPQLSSRKSILLDISDVNDNPPVFLKSRYIAYLPENNLPGASIYKVQASDSDIGENSKVIYSVFNTNTEAFPVSPYFSINIETGVLYAQRSFDYEQHKEFAMHVQAKDNGYPSLSSNATLIIRIIDQNDNAPKILYPSTENSDSLIFEMVPFASMQGSLVTKVVAVDDDSGHNSWLSYHFIQISEPFPFSISQQTGEIKTTRVFQEKDVLKHKVVIMVKDNGDPSLSATATLSLVVADYIQEVVPQLSNTLTDDNTSFNLQMYLMIALALISLLFILTIILVIISKCKDSKPSPVLGLQSANLYSQVDPGMLSRFNNGTLTLPYSYNVCVSLDQSEADFTFIKPKQNVPIDNLIDADDSGLGNETMKDTLTPANAWQQAQPNADWRVSQAQRPGPSGAQPTEESGVWPNNQFETERLQAMILASANEAAEGSAIGGGTGTMGLSARYGPQFTLQHLPDYRQNIYIPGTTSTLTNAAGKGKSAAPSGGNKKKSGKKDKK
ncbi:protocadherin gamma-B1 isoform X10 [Xenopus tropicalis]|uniref:Protocadherin gamma-B1 isoform X10 n=1 Tax=Xenopus tropicalis TaxID=8364 RepID=A0A8J1JC90_XENTR|nr:protocadherin gamma-B1 isoform X10 [Xenopus tropicalis]